MESLYYPCCNRMNPSLFYLLPAFSTSKTSSSASSISLSSSPATKLASDYSSPAIHKAFYFPTPLVHHPPARKGDFTTSFSSLPLFMAPFSSNAPPTKRRLLVSQSPTRTRQIRAHASGFHINLRTWESCCPERSSPDPSQQTNKQEVLAFSKISRTKLRPFPLQDCWIQKSESYLSLPMSLNFLLYILTGGTLIGIFPEN